MRPLIGQCSRPYIYILKLKKNHHRRMEPASKVSASAFSLKVRDKKDLYELASRNGFFLPSFKSRAVTEDYLIGILRT